MSSSLGVINPSPEILGVACLFADLEFPLVAKSSAIVLFIAVRVNVNWIAHGKRLRSSQCEINR